MKRLIAIIVIALVLLVGCAGVKGTSNLTVTVEKDPIFRLYDSMITQSNGYVGKGAIVNETVLVCAIAPPDHSRIKISVVDTKDMITIMAEAETGGDFTFVQARVINFAWDPVQGLIYSYELIASEVNPWEEVARIMRPLFDLLTASEQSAEEAATKYYKTVVGQGPYDNI